MLKKRDDESVSRKRRSDEQITRESSEVAPVDTTAERMKAINSLLTGSAETMAAKTGATKLSPQDTQTAAAMKLAVAFDAFKPLE